MYTIGIWSHLELGSSKGFVHGTELSPGMKVTAVQNAHAPLTRAALDQA